VVFSVVPPATVRRSRSVFSVVPFASEAKAKKKSIGIQRSTVCNKKKSIGIQRSAVREKERVISSVVLFGKQKKIDVVQECGVTRITK